MVETHSGWSESSGHLFELSGGALCLDFVNTLGDRPIRKNEHLRDFSDLLAWGLQAGVLEPFRADRLSTAARLKPQRALAALEKAIESRETLYRVFSLAASNQRPSKQDLVALNEVLREAWNHLRLELKDGVFYWHWEDSCASLDSVLWAVSRSAADLLTSAEAELVRECASDTCSWLFVDRSRNARRRWCDMKTCGNRAKARRHYRRKQAGETRPRR